MCEFTCGLCTCNCYLEMIIHLGLIPSSQFIVFNQGVVKRYSTTCNGFKIKVLSQNVICLSIYIYIEAGGGGVGGGKGAMTGGGGQ